MAVRDVVQAAAGVGGDKLYAEDVFSTYLYTGNGATQTITNGIDLAGEGGLVWIKNRSISNTNHHLVDSERTPAYTLRSDTTDAQQLQATRISSFNSNGFSLGDGNAYTNYNGSSHASWTFRKAPKFFDVVEFTVGANGTDTILNHNLGSTPGLVITKLTSASSIWAAHHRSLNLAGGEYLVLNTTAAKATWDSVSFSDTQVNLGTFWTHASTGQTGIAYIFAHDAGGFGDDGEQNVISCGSYAGSATDWATGATLGWEPQWVLIKNVTTGATDWHLFDNMRGMFVSTSPDPVLWPNLSNAEDSFDLIRPTATGFEVASSSRVGSSGNTYIYIAIRRGPMKTPESGTEVFVTNTGSYASAATVNVGFATDLSIISNRGGSSDKVVEDSMRGYQKTSSTGFPSLASNTTAAETTGVPTLYNRTNTTVQVPTFWSGGSPGAVIWNFRRAPGFFDVVAYTGNNSATHSIPHNLTVAPQLIIVKRRDGAEMWPVYAEPIGISNHLRLEHESGITETTIWGTPTTSNFIVKGGFGEINVNNGKYIAYLFASLPGVSKVGSYTGTGTTQTINCGFSSGARFVLIKRTDSTGHWYVWDSARGIVAGNDPYLLLNRTDAEVTSTDYIDPVASGFEISSSAPAAINASGGTFIFLAIA